jgi:hypothetical protein
LLEALQDVEFDVVVPGAELRERRIDAVEPLGAPHLPLDFLEFLEVVCVDHERDSLHVAMLLASS